jgi:hypothetical protein
VSSVALDRAGAPSHTIRVALTDLRWPLDPAFADTRDETTVALAVYATPLRTDPAGRVVSGLCTGDWRTADAFRLWTFSCAHAVEIAAELRRIGRLRGSPAHWLFAGVRTVTVPAPGKLVVRLRSSWRRFPYALTAVAAAPRNVAGPFRVVRAAPTRLELAQNGTTLVFRRMTAWQALRAFRRHELDEAPVPLGDLAYVRKQLRDVRMRRVLAQDVVAFRGNVPLEVRRAYWDTANRADYQALVPGNAATAALALIGTPKPNPAAFRRAVDRIPDLPVVRVRIAVPKDPTLAYGARLLFGQWREVGLAPQLVAAGAPADAVFRRVLAPYPQDEALLGALGVDAGLGVVDQRNAFAAVDAHNAADASIIPVCWVADARLVAPSLTGWREDVLGNVDYTNVARS